MAIKLQGLRREFETLQMQTGESVQIFLSRVTNVVNQIRAFGDTMEEKTVVAKVLRSLTPKFDHVVAAIEESKDLDTYTFDELMGSLQTHEARLSKSEDKGDEKAFYTQGETLRGRGRGRRGRGRGNFGRGRGRGRSNTTEDTPTYDESKKEIQCYYCNKFGHYQSECNEFKKGIQCHYCNKYGHYQAECYKKQRDETQANYAEEKDAQPTLFMVSNSANKIDASSIWFLDSGYSNHMFGYKHLFEELDESYKKSVRLGNDKEIQVEGIGKVAVQTRNSTSFAGENCRIVHSATDQIMASSGSENELVKYVECSERERKVSELMGLDSVKSNGDVTIVQCEGNGSELTHGVVNQGDNEEIDSVYDHLLKKQKKKRLKKNVKQWKMN